GNQLTREQAAALGVTQDRLRELGRATAQLSSQQRAQVSNERELVRARQASSQVTREVAQQSRDLARSQRDQISSTQQTVRAAGISTAPCGRCVLLCRTWAGRCSNCGRSPRGSHNPCGKTSPRKR